MVDAIFASCCASFPDHDLAHIGVTPMRLMPGIVQMIFGEDYDLPVYAKIITDFVRWVFLPLLEYE